jgi:hypothetical protein
LQKLTIAEPDTVLTFLSFAAFVLWWNGASRGGVSIIRWIGCGCLLSVLAMAKGPQPVGFFALGVLAYLILERQWRELPSFLLCLVLPALATIAWGLLVYRPGDNATWLAYARLDAFPDPFDYAQEKFRTVAQTILELMPGLLVLPFVPWPWRNRRAMSAAVPSVTSPLILYSLVCTVALFFWPGAHSRYAMPIVPSLAVLEGFGWDAIASFKYTPLRRAMAAALGILVAYQFILVVAIMPLYADLFGMSRRDGIAISEAIRLSPAPVYCAGLDTNQLFYVNQRKRCLNPAEWASLAPPAWLLLDPASLARFAGLRPDAKLHVVVETKSGPHLAAVRFE